MITPFSHRAHAGEVLARSLARFAGRHDVTVLGVPNGGAAVAFEVARHLSAPLELCFFEPIKSPQGDVTLGLLGWPPAQQLHEPIINALGLGDEAVRQATAQTWRQLRERIHALRPPAPPPTLHGRMVILVDEGVAQGVVLQEAATLVRRTGARTVVAAVPVGAREGLRLLASEFDDVICPWQPVPFESLSPFYGDFRPVTDAEVRTLLRRAWGDWGRVDSATPDAS
jgi:putative phosphoribosyl transferase